MIDKIDLILGAIELRPMSLADLSSETGIPGRPPTGWPPPWSPGGTWPAMLPGASPLGTRISELAAGDTDDWLVGVATPILSRLRDQVHESAQLYRRRGDRRLCVVSVEPESGLRDSVPAGTLLAMTAGSAAQVMVAWGTPEQVEQACQGARFTPADLVKVRRHGWAHTVAEREPGLASLSAPVRGEEDKVLAAVSISGPIARGAAPSNRTWCSPCSTRPASCPASCARTELGHATGWTSDENRRARTPPVGRDRRRLYSTRAKR